MKRLSIIVPVYNVEKYLAKCLDSLLCQDIPLNDYEIIIINDGSTDGSFTIAESFTQQYQHIKLISQENLGLSEARNTGIGIARGNYLMFVDSDDFLEKKSLGELLTYIEKNELDVLRYNYQNADENNILIPKVKNAVYAVHFSEKVVTGQDFMGLYLGYACYVWTYFFKTSLIKENGFTFYPGIYFEDVEWLPRVLCKAERVCSINNIVYNYVLRQDSITQSIDISKKQKVLKDKLYIIDVLKQMSINADNKYVALWCQSMISFTVLSILGYVAIHFRNNKKEYINQLKKRAIFPIGMYQFSPKQKRDAVIANLSPYLYCFLKGRNISKIL